MVHSSAYLSQDVFTRERYNWSLPHTPSKLATMSEEEKFKFVHRQRVRWTEVDLQGVVFFGHYYAYFDHGMTEYFRELGYPYPDAFVDETTDTFIKHCECDYHGSARYDDKIDIHVRMARMGRSSLNMAFRVTCGDDLLVTGSVVYVFADPNTRQSKPIPDVLREAVQAFESFSN